MPNVKKISFGKGNADLEAEQGEVQRRQMMIDALRRQATTPQETQMVSGRAVSNQYQGLAQLAQIGASVYAQKQVDDKQAGITQQVSEREEAERKRRADALRNLAPKGVFDDGAPQPGAMPADTAQGFTPPADQKPQIDPAMKERWVRALATYEQNPELGGKLIQDLSKEAEFSTTPQYDQQGNGFVLNNRGERKSLDGVRARDKLENVNGVWQNPYAQQNGAVGPQDPNQPFSVGPDGQPMANSAYQAYAMSKAKAGAPNITTKTEVKAAESIAGQVGPILKDSYIAAQGANAQIDAASRVVQAVDTDKMFAGPLASKRLSLAQFGQTLGIGGKDDAEKIANTRQAIRGLAELTLQGRKSMRGEGAITESEGKLAEKAMSGDIDSMTPAELKIVAQSSARVARYNLAEHNRKVEKARANPATAGIAGYFESQPLEPAAAPAPNTTGFKVIR